MSRCMQARCVVGAVAAMFVWSALYAEDSPRDTVEKKVARKALPSMVTIAIPVQSNVRVIGSGFVVDSRGYILTNQHVTGGRKEVLVGLYDEKAKGGKKQWLKGEVLFESMGDDLAVVKVEAEKALPELRLGPSSDLEVGEPAIAIGNPKGEAFTVTKGIISRLQVPDEREDEKKNKVTIYMIQTDAAINPGNSGCPLFNAHGEVIGVIELKYNGAEGLGYAITSDRAQRAVAAGMSAEKKEKVKHGVKSFEMKVLHADPKEGQSRQAVIVKKLEKDSPPEKPAVEKKNEKPELLPAPKPASDAKEAPEQGRVKLLEKLPSEDGKPATSAPKEMPKETAKEAPKAAVKAGEVDCPLKVGDQILKVGDRLITNVFDFERSFWDKKPGDKVEVTVLRDGKECKATITLGGEGIEVAPKD